MSDVNKWNLEDREFRLMVEQVKSELAEELGLTVPPDGDWGKTSSKDLGKLGSQLRKRIAVLLEWKGKDGIRTAKLNGCSRKECRK